jgi:hypothetical protein
MARPAPRPCARRKADVVAKLGEHEADVWVASASADGVAHLVPLSLAWDGECIVVALEQDSLTARNVTAGGRARLALGPTRDVVVIDAVLDVAVPVTGEPSALAEEYAEQAGWDPRDATEGAYVYLRLRPVRIQAWREADEIAGRTVMRDGRWRC